MRFLTRCLLSSVVAMPAVANANGVKAIVDTRLRYEHVDQDGLTKTADALTVRGRFGLEATAGAFAALAEVEGTGVLDNHYFSGVNNKSAYPIVADPGNLELNRIQLQYKGLPGTLITAGRQRINLDDQRFVGAVGWRQNEQTFDAVRVEWLPVQNLKLDMTYSWSNRTIWGMDGGENGYTQRPQSIDGDNVFANAAYKTKYGTLTGFYYRVEEDEAVAALQRNSSRTIGARFAGSHPLSKTIKWNYAVSYARQSAIGVNPLDYAADYYLADSTIDIGAAKLGAGVEILGSDTSVRTKVAGLPYAGGFAFQTPFATLHKFQGWADKFLTTPAEGITDYYASAGYSWTKVGPLDAISATAVYHRFDSDAGDIRYGSEIDLQLLVKVKKYSFIAKYADYQRRGIANFTGDADTGKFWLSAEWAF